MVRVSVGVRVRVSVRVTWSPVVHATLITLSATLDPGSAAEDAGACWSETPLSFGALSVTLGLGLGFWLGLVLGLGLGLGLRLTLG